MEEKQCDGIDCAWCTCVECPNEKKEELDRNTIAEKFINAYNKHFKEKIEGKWLK